MDDKECGPPPGTTAPSCTPSHATPTTLNELRFMDDEEYGPPPGTTAPSRAPSHATPTTLNELRLTDDKENAKERKTQPTHTATPLARFICIHTRP